MSLVSIGGRKVIHGGNGLAEGLVDSSHLPQIMEAVHSRKFGHAQQLNALYVQQVSPSNMPIVLFWQLLGAQINALGI